MQKEKGGHPEPVQIHNHIYHQLAAAPAPAIPATNDNNFLVPEHYIPGEDMKAMDFKIGEIIDLNKAIRLWASEK